MIYITGDTHAGWMNRLNMNSFPEQREMTKKDYVIICGDFGIWNKSKRENHALDWLESKTFTTLFVSGNHENYDILDALPIEMWNGGHIQHIRPSVIHLMRGEVFEIDDAKFFTFGGASSHDIQDGILEPGDIRIKRWSQDCNKMFRVNHETWWERELPSEEEMLNGKKNLKLANNKVDFIVTHCAPSSVVKAIESSYGTDVLTNYLEEVKNEVEYKKWFFGHYHINAAPFANDLALYEQIVRIL